MSLSQQANGHLGGRLWSLLDMITFKVDAVLKAQDVLALLVQLIGSRHSSSVYPKVSQKVRGDLRDHVTALLPHLAPDEFTLCRKGAERILKTIEQTDDSHSIQTEVQSLRTRLLDQTEGTYCLLLTPSEKQLYEPSEPPFGKDVEAKFPSANEDIYEASKCLALGRGTASVMHLMRVVEAGLKCLAGMLDVGAQGDWGGYIRAIENELEARIKAAGKRTADEQFYAEAKAMIDNVRRAWRNPTMHIEKTYTPERADEIYRAVRSLMNHLATRLAEYLA